MSCKDEAERLFGRIGIGAQNAVKRPANSYTDRALRAMIEDANVKGDYIISGKTGYYRPRKSVPEEDYEFNRYERQELRRARTILYKRKSMKEAYERVGCIYEG